ncbi:hypothetical protein HYU09_02625 [Candidatus Woesearchaeota archaeon]|nr:hypothetical protein [Candidatus Woesearchaeota archaeon]
MVKEKKKQNKLKKELILLVIAVILAAYYLNQPNFKCKTENDIKQDECFAELAYKNSNEDYCRQINDNLIKDACYLSLIVEGIYNSSYICSELDNRYLQYVCLRISPRPHMKEFISKRSVTKDIDIQGMDCQDYNRFNKVVCLYVKAAENAKTNLSKAESLCDSISNKTIRDECYFYIITSLIIGSNNISKKKEFLIDYCQDIKTNNWKSECFYVIADELSFQKPDGFIKGAADACLNSTKYKDFKCYNHVALNLNFNEGNQFCNFADESNKISCYVGIGHNLAINFNDYNEAFGECRKINNKFNETCLITYAAKTGALIVKWEKDLVKANENCLKLPKKYDSICFIGIGNEASKLFNFQISKILDNIELIREEHKKDFAVGVGWSYSREFRENNINKLQLKEAMSSIPQEFNEDFFYGFGGFVSFKSKYNDTKINETCLSIANDFKDECIRGKDAWHNFSFYLDGDFLLYPRYYLNDLKK